MVKRRVVVAVFVFALATVALLLWLNRPTGGGRGVDPYEVNRVFSEELESEGTVDVSDRDALRTALQRVPHGPPPGLPEPDALPPDVAPVTPPPEVHARLLTVLEEFFTHLSAADPEAYASWMRSRGYQLSRDEELLQGYAPKGWSEDTGKETPSGSDHDAIFNQLFSESLSQGDGQLRPVAISLADDGGYVRYLRLGIQALDASRSALFIHGGAEIRRWVGYVVMGARKHWAPPISLEQVVEGDGYADCALVSIGVLGAAGDWIPANIFMYYDPEGEDWHIDLIGIVNAPRLASTWDY